MAMLLGQDWWGAGHGRAQGLLVTWVPEGLEQADRKPSRSPPSCPGQVQAEQRKEPEAKATLVESVEDTGHAAIPREMGQGAGLEGSV